MTNPLDFSQPVMVAAFLQFIIEITDDQPAFGWFDTPADGVTGVTGAIPVTGWALDDIGVTRVELWRRCVGVDYARSVCGSPLRDGGRTHVYLGDAAFLPGARPDVAAVYPNTPAATRAGWGYLMLTNALPHSGTGAAEGGQGTFTLEAFAFTGEGQLTLLGSKTITLDNDRATRPFGALDTPGQGVTIPEAAAPYNNAAAYPVFGWAMTQAGKCIDTTTTAPYSVYVDGVARTLTPGVNWFAGLNRADLAAAYPGLCNSANALAAYYLDARTLANGLHTIGWDVTDSGNNTAGIGSRPFNVLLPATEPVVRAEPDMAPSRATSVPRSARADRTEIRARVGGDDAPWQTVVRDHTGTLAVRVPIGGRVVLDLGGAVAGGALLGSGGARALPPGSTLDAAAGRFYWMPPVGFLGTFELAFDDAVIAVTLFDPTTQSDELEVVVTSPRSGANPNPIVTVAGTVRDPRAVSGPGVPAVHVWARRVDTAGSDAFFLGAAALSAERFSLRTSPLAAGTYEVMVFAWSARHGTWAPARVVTIAVVQRDPIQPGGEGPRGIVPGVRLPEVDDDFQGEVLAVGLARGVCVGHLEHHPAMAIELIRKCASEVAGDGVLVAWPFTTSTGELPSARLRYNQPMILAHEGHACFEQVERRRRIRR